MNKIAILVIIIGIVIVGIIAAVGIESDTSASETQSPSASEVVVEEDELGSKHFSVTISDEVGVSDKPK